MVALAGRKLDAHGHGRMHPAVGSSEGSSGFTRDGVDDHVRTSSQGTGFAAQGRTVCPIDEWSRAYQYLEPGCSSRLVGVPAPARYFDEQSGAVVCPGPCGAILGGADGDSNNREVMIDLDEAPRSQHGEHPTIVDPHIGFEVGHPSGGSLREERIE